MTLHLCLLWTSKTSLYGPRWSNCKLCSTSIPSCENLYSASGGQLLSSPQDMNSFPWKLSPVLRQNLFAALIRLSRGCLQPVRSPGKLTHSCKQSSKYTQALTPPYGCHLIGADASMSVTRSTRTVLQIHDYTSTTLLRLMLFPKTSAAAIYQHARKPCSPLVMLQWTQLLPQPAPVAMVRSPLYYAEGSWCQPLLLPCSILF